MLKVALDLPAEVQSGGAVKEKEASLGRSTEGSHAGVRQRD
jgi:hypothetical protein